MGVLNTCAANLRPQQPTNQQKKQNHQDGALDGVRAIALLMVMSFHSLFLSGLRA